MRAILIILIFFFIPGFLFSKPYFKEIKFKDSSNYRLFSKMKFHNNLIYLGIDDGICILDSSLKLVNKVNENQLNDLVKKDLGLPDDSNLVSTTICNFNIDNKDNLWIATTQGVFVYKDSIIKIYHNKNSRITENFIQNIQFEQDTAIINPGTVQKLYYVCNDSVRIMQLPDSTNEALKWPSSTNALQFKNKYYYIGNYRNLVEIDKNIINVYSYKTFTDMVNPKVFPILKENSDTIYFFEGNYSFKLFKFCNGNIKVYDFLKNNIIDIDDSCYIDICDFDFDKDNNLWLLFSKINKINFNATQYILKYKNDQVTEFYNIYDCFENPLFGLSNISIDTTHNIMYGFNVTFIYQSDMTTDIKYETESIPNLYLNKVYPNPVNNKFNVDFSTLPSKFSKLQVKLYNYFGAEIENLNTNIIYNSVNSMGTIEIETGTIPNGLYLVTLSNGDFTLSRKMIVLH